jgi:hypothetical protein
MAKVQSKPPKKEKYIDSPETLWGLFLRYVEHEASNPMFRVDYVGKDGERVNTPLQVPITFEGFECFVADLGIINDLGDYSSNRGGSYDSYSPIITHIRRNCFVQNFKGAAVGLFNANLVAKKLGLIEKAETTIIEQPLFPAKKEKDVSENHSHR